MNTPVNRACIVVAAVLTAGVPSTGYASEQRIASEPEAYLPDQVAIGLERTVCFGACPVYRLTISGDGTVKYFGIQWVGAEGARESKMEPATVAELINAVFDNRLFERPDEYDNGTEVVEYRDGKYFRFGRGAPSDVPSAILSIELGPRRKRVVLRSGYPKELGQLADMIDQATDSIRWTARQ